MSGADPKQSRAVLSNSSALHNTDLANQLALLPQLCLTKAIADNQKIENMSCPAASGGWAPQTMQNQS